MHGAYIRNALDKGFKPCTEENKYNKAFAEKFKKIKQWSDLTITEKYCRHGLSSKEFYYHMPEKIFKDALLNLYEIYHENGQAGTYQYVG